MSVRHRTHQDAEGSIVALPANGLPDLAVVLVYLAVLFVPGGLLAARCGVRGWTLAATAPLVTYAVAGFAGPVYATAGVRWTIGTATFAFALAYALAAVVGLVVRHRYGRVVLPDRLPAWAPLAHAGVTLVVAVVAVTGVVVILGGIRFLGAIPQDWDAVFHANGIRYIADTGDGGLYGMARTNWYEDDVTVFYPNAYHLVAAVVYELTGATIPTVLNAHTVLIPGLLALGLVALVRRFGGRPMLAAATALVSVAVTSFYDMLWRGPLLPFATGVALTPLLVVLATDLLDAVGRREVLRTGAAFVLGMTGLLCLHPATLISAILFSAPAFVQRWCGRPRGLLREFGRLTAAGIVAAWVCVLQLSGAASSAGNLAAVFWPADLTVGEAIEQLLLFGHAAESEQIALTVLLALGVVFYHRLGELRWIGASGIVFAALFVIAAAYEDPWAKQITSLWWNDRWRLIAMAALAFCAVMGNGVAEVQRLVARGLQAVLGRLRPAEGRPRRVSAVAVATAAAAILGTVVGTDGLYVSRDQERMTANTGEGPAVSSLEIAGMYAVAEIVPPGTRVLNDRADGSVWMYALTGVRPVAAHYDGYRIGPAAALLAERFNAYPDDPAVQQAVADLGIRFVQVNEGFLRDWAYRAPGLENLADAPWLALRYANPDVQLYEIVGPPAPGEVLGSEEER
ncbi:hypothetical protein SAMN05443637_106265 [Pseudonocardia thermophila]|uniref:Uncharacterized protein n=2 Tax=Pseudonocardia thermophila TaxID=1848 RepID=A0A1M6SPA1_PSETH|nr:hypothetical protein SAMN05443637_106265 [Pseudonocardia thermophila]